MAGRYGDNPLTWPEARKWLNEAIIRAGRDPGVGACAGCMTSGILVRRDGKWWCEDCYPEHYPEE